ncbi:MAG TPA: hypothetical protein VLB81_02445 [Gaiellales bacterium]|nr:hypothetical protein [Gaiellales bacterium]
MTTSIGSSPSWCTSLQSWPIAVLRNAITRNPAQSTETPSRLQSSTRHAHARRTKIRPKAEQASAKSEPA